MSWKNALFKALIFLFKKRNIPKDFSEKHFLIVSTTGLGDTLWGTPAIRALKKTFPQHQIYVLTSPIGHEVLKTNPYIEKLIVVKNSLLSSLRPLLQLRKETFEATLVFHTSQRFILPLCALCETPKIIGTQGLNKGLDSLLTTALEKKEQHEIERRLDIVQEIGAKVEDSDLEIRWTREDEDDVLQFLKKHHLSQGEVIIGFNPGAKDPFKRWAPEHFIELGNLLCQTLECRIIVTGSKQEKKLVRTIAKQIPGAVPLYGKLSLPALTKLIQTFSLMITNDTGPMHLSFAAKCPTVALFSPTNPDLCGPYEARNHTIIARAPTCTPCLKKRCHTPFCLSQIPVSQVYQEALKLYEANK